MSTSHHRSLVIAATNTLSNVLQLAEDDSQPSIQPEVLLRWRVPVSWHAYLPLPIRSLLAVRTIYPEVEKSTGSWIVFSRYYGPYFDPAT